MRHPRGNNRHNSSLSQEVATPGRRRIIFRVIHIYMNKNSPQRLFLVRCSSPFMRLSLRLTSLCARCKQSAMSVKFRRHPSRHFKNASAIFYITTCMVISPPSPNYGPPRSSYLHPSPVVRLTIHAFSPSHYSINSPTCINPASSNLHLTYNKRFTPPPYMHTSRWVFETSPEVIVEHCMTFKSHLYWRCFVLSSSQ